MINGLSMDYQWIVNGLSMDYQWNQWIMSGICQMVHGISMGYFSGILMGVYFLMYSEVIFIRQSHSMSTADESAPVGFGEMPISLADDHNLPSGELT